MSQFVFGEVLLPEDKNIIQFDMPDIHNLPFELRFHLNQYDFYYRRAPIDRHVIPFVITDGPFDNTAEYLLRPDSIVCEDARLQNQYKRILSLTLEERVAQIVSILKKVLNQIGASECILVLCDGTIPQDSCTPCKIEHLAEMLKESIMSSTVFASSYYLIEIN